VTDAAIDRLRTENRRVRAEKAMRQKVAHREALPTQRPNGLTPMSSPWFIDNRGWWCRLLSADPQIVADYVALMGGQSLTPDTNASMLPPSAAQKERSCDKERATGGSNTGSPLD
jgi:hypothetical protein